VVGALWGPSFKGKGKACWGGKRPLFFRKGKVLNPRSLFFFFLYFKKEGRIWNGRDFLSSFLTFPKKRFPQKGRRNFPSSNFKGTYSPKKA